MPRRRRRILAYMILTMLIYNDYSSVRWVDYGRCEIKSRPFAELMGTNTTHLRLLVLFLEQQGYVRDVLIGHGYIQLNLVQPRRYL